MSIWPPIWNTIKSHEAAGRLSALRPRSPDENSVRAMFLTADLYGALTASYPEPDEAARYMALQARLEVFVDGSPITNSYLKPLYPPRKAVWEIVNKKPNPSIRVFGLFATRNVFIGTHHQLRNVLGGFNTPMWKAEIRRSRLEWAQLFEDEPLVGELHEVVTGAVYV